MRTALLFLSILSLASSATEVVTTDHRYWQELGLADAELTRFEQLVVVPGLVSESISRDPLLVLGIYAKDKPTQERFARLYLHRELDRAERQLAFFRIYAELYDREFGNQPIINLAKLGIDTSTTRPTAAARVSVIVTDQCKPCDVLTVSIAKRVERGELSGADIYLAGATDDEVVQVFAKRLSLNTDVIASGKITLNLGDALAHQLKTKTYPAVYKRQGDQLHALSLAERLTLMGPSP